MGAKSQRERMHVLENHLLLTEKYCDLVHLSGPL